MHETSPVKPRQTQAVPPYAISFTHTSQRTSLSHTQVTHSHKDSLTPPHGYGLQEASIGKAKAFESAVAKAPKFDGITYRGVKHLKPGSAYHTALTTPGTTIEMLNHACTSRKTSEAYGFSLGNTVVRMRSKSGGVIEDISGFKHEHETVMPRGTTFRVVRAVENVNMTGHGNIKTVIDLEEVEPHDTSIKVSLSLVEALSLSQSSREDRFQETEPGVNWIVRLPIDKVIGPE